ncbi:MAG: hypothetical protein E7514_06195 [Ruminococcaceae bacterium]|nr:hypothetical protein [Oscillospiraceae bacterium]
MAGTHYYVIALTAGIILTFVFLILRVKKGGFFGLFSKTVASVAFIVTAITAANEKRAILEFSLFMILGFMFGMLGDIWLDLKWIYVEEKDYFLYAGFISFLVGHIFFVSAIVHNSPWTVQSVIIAVAGAVAIATIAVLLEKPMKLEYGKFKPIVFLYSTTLSLTLTSSAVTAFITGFETAWVVMTIGAALFLFSDLVLSGMYFAKEQNKNTPVNVVINHTLYYAAQFILASAIHFVK